MHDRIPPPLHHIHGNLSNSIFVWDETDYNHLLLVKKGELTSTGVSTPSDSAARKALTREELARHYRRRTRGVGEMTQLIEELLSLLLVTDTHEVPLLKQEMKGYLEKQQKHIACLQDPPDVKLYSVTRELQKGGVTLPVLRCVPGSTSLSRASTSIFLVKTTGNRLCRQADLTCGGPMR